MSLIPTPPKEEVLDSLNIHIQLKLVNTKPQDNFMDPLGESQVHFTNFLGFPFIFKCQQKVGDYILNIWSDSSTSIKLLAIANPQSSQHTHSPLGG